MINQSLSITQHKKKINLMIIFYNILHCQYKRNSILASSNALIYYFLNVVKKIWYKEELAHISKAGDVAMCIILFYDKVSVFIVLESI